MILKKPYAFLIKHFMLIHIVLSVFMIYVCMKFREALSFINEYISNTAPISTAGSYFTVFVYLAILFVIAISFTIFWLMRYKKKPKLLYFLNIVLFVILLFIAIVLGSTFSSLDDQVLSSRTSRLYRDIVTIFNFIQYGFILAMIIRTLGFDVKKFDFASDVKEMEISNEDNEEVEITLGVDSNKILRSIRHYFRELGYYYKENKVIILSLAGLLVLGFVIYMLFNFKIVNTYKENQTVVTSDYALKVTDSYLSNLKYDGTNVSLKDQTYLIVKMNLQATKDENKKLNIDDYILEIKNKRYYPVKKYYQYFKDIGSGYTSQVLTYGDYKTYIMMFAVDNEYINKKMLLTNVITDRSIKLDPSNLDSEISTEKISLSQTLEYKDTVIGDGKITIKDYEFADSFENIVAGYNKKVLKLGVDTSIVGYSNYEFLNTFVKLKYIKDDRTYSMSFENRTSKKNDGTIYLEVNKSIEEASKIYLEIKIRNKVYNYYIKA